jgi:hypothetical protein
MNNNGSWDTQAAVASSSSISGVTVSIGANGWAEEKTTDDKAQSMSIAIKT